MGHLWLLLLKPKARGDKWYEIHRYSRVPFQNIQAGQFLSLKYCHLTDESRSHRYSALAETVVQTTTVLWITCLDEASFIFLKLIFYKFYTVSAEINLTETVPASKSAEPGYHILKREIQIKKRLWKSIHSCQFNVHMTSIFILQINILHY